MNTYINPWNIVVGRINVADQFDMKEFYDEVFLLQAMAGQEDPSQERLDPELLPILMNMRDNVITPAVVQYAQDVWEYTIPKIEVETNAKWIPEGEGLFPHYHAGSCLSAICYPQDSESGINFFDPRGHACRGYPKEIRDRFFAAWRVSPRAGDIYIFPSYIQHSVSYVKEDVRLSLLHEYYLRENV